MKKITYLLLAALGFVVLGAGVVFAQNYKNMMGLSPQDLAARQQAMFQQTADILGISIDDVKNGWANGETVTQIAKDHNISQQQLQQKMQAYANQQMQQELQTLVSQGVISQDQANKRMQVMQGRMQSGGNSGGGMCDGCVPQQQQQQQQPQSQQ